MNSLSYLSIYCNFFSHQATSCPKQTNLSGKKLCCLANAHFSDLFLGGELNFQTKSNQVDNYTVSSHFAKLKELI